MTTEHADVDDAVREFSPAATSTDEPEMARERSTFPRTRGRTRGYEPAAVDAFLDRARAVFEQGATDDGLDSALVRAVAFPLVRSGYEVAVVDAALGRIEDAFAERERQRSILEQGAGAWVEQARATAQEMLDRLSRPRRRRFRRAGWLRFGYRIDEVDLVADKLRAYLESGFAVSADQVRGAAFRMQRRGYDEAQVDALLDAMVDVMLAVR